MRTLLCTATLLALAVRTCAGQIPNQRVCANQSVEVATRSDYEFYEFTPAAGVLWNVLWRARLNPTATTEYRVRARRRLPRELITDPGFTAGTGAYTSELRLGGGGFELGQAVAVANTGSLPGAHAACGDPSGGPRDRLLAFRLGADRRARLVCQDIRVVAGAEYRFESKVATLVGGVPVGFAWEVDGVPLGRDAGSDPSACTWRTFARDYVAPATATARVCVVAEAPRSREASGGLDDVSFRRYDADHVEAFTVNVLPAPAPRDTTVQTCAAGRFRGFGLDLAVGQVGQLRIPLGRGCDSIVNVRVAAAPPGGLVDSVTYGPVCAGAAVAIGGERFTASRDTLLRRALVSRDGCDSTVFVAVEVFEDGDVEAELTAPTCDRADGRLTLRIPAGARVEWTDGSTEPSRAGLAAGDVLEAVVTLAQGCAARYRLRLPGAGPSPVAVLRAGVTCPGDLAEVRVEVPEGVDASVLGLAGGVSAVGDGEDLRLPPGTYALSWRGGDGCLYTSALAIAPPANPPPLRLVGDSVWRLGRRLALSVVGEDPAHVPTELTWRLGGRAIASAGGRQLMLRGERRGGELTLDYLDAAGCPVTLRRTILVERAREVAFATAFSPNADGVNDALTLSRHPGIARLLRARVYDRWGGHLRTVTEVEPGGAVWDGLARDGRASPSGTYVVAAELLLADGTTESFTTTTQVVR